MWITFHINKTDRKTINMFFLSASFYPQIKNLNFVTFHNRWIWGVNSNAGVAPYHYESSQFTAKHTAITKKGSRYLRKTLYQIILPVILHNEVFFAYYHKKLAEGKGHRCAQGHCIRKLLRIIYHLLSTGQPFSPELLV